MSEKELKKRFAGGALMTLMYLTLLLFITRLWPLLLVAILGIFVALIRLMFLSSGKVETVTPVSTRETKEKEPTTADLRAMAFHLIEKRITELLMVSYSDIRWIWENTEPKKDIMGGQPVYVVVNRAGGYRRMQVVIRNLQVCDVVPVSELCREESPQGDDGYMDDVGEENRMETVEPIEDVPVNYGLFAFEWVEAHVEELNKRCNEALGQGQHLFVISKDELPERESWKEICLELDRNGLEVEICQDEGIQIKFSQ